MLKHVGTMWAEAMSILEKAAGSGSSKFMVIPSGGRTGAARSLFSKDSHGTRWNGIPSRTHCCLEVPLDWIIESPAPFNWSRLVNMVVRKKTFETVWSIEACWHWTCATSRGASSSIPSMQEDPRPVVSLDMRRMNKILWIRHEDRIACIEAGDHWTLFERSIGQILGCDMGAAKWVMWSMWDHEKAKTCRLTLVLLRMCTLHPHYSIQNL